MTAFRALVIDNNLALAETVAEILADRGYAVDVATSGVQALVAWRNRPADLVLLDVDLPDIGGLALARRLARRAGGCTLVVMSAGDPQRLTPLCQELGASFLAKPFTASHLATVVRLVVQQRVEGAELGKGDGSLLCEAPRGQFLQKTPVPFSEPIRHLLAHTEPRALLQRPRPRRRSR